jgi:UDP-N-acetylmuramoyl-tripeptide--D-alanyl-D-alanine ligase
VAVDCAAEALAELEALPGRGRRHELAWRGGTLTVIDESYNASPPSMRAALAVLAATEPGAGARRVAVLGDMLELGDASECLHRDLAEPLAAAGVDRVFLIGEAIAALWEVLPEGKRGGLWRSPEEAMPALLRFLEPGDVVTVKGSRAVRVSRVVELLRAQSARPECRQET